MNTVLRSSDPQYLRCSYAPATGSHRACFLPDEEVERTSGVRNEEIGRGGRKGAILIEVLTGRVFLAFLYSRLHVLRWLVKTYILKKKREQSAYHCRMGDSEF